MVPTYNKISLAVLCITVLYSVYLVVHCFHQVEPVAVILGYTLSNSCNITPQ